MKTIAGAGIRIVAAALAAAAIAGLVSCASEETSEPPSAKEWLEENPTIFAKIRDGDEEERREAVARLRSLGPERGIPIIMWILSDPELEDYRLEVVLARVLADWRDPRAIPFLLLGLRLPDAPAKLASEGLLVFGNRPEVLDALEGLLQENDPQVRLMAATTLARIGSQRAAGILGRRLGEEAAPEVRAQIVIGILRSEHPLRREFLIEALDDPDLAIRELAWGELQRSRDLPAVDYDPSASSEDRAAAIAMLRVWLETNRTTRRGGVSEGNVSER